MSGFPGAPVGSPLPFSSTRLPPPQSTHLLNPPTNSVREPPLSLFFKSFQSVSLFHQHSRLATAFFRSAPLPCSLFSEHYPFPSHISSICAPFTCLQESSGSPTNHHRSGARSWPRGRNSALRARATRDELPRTRLFSTCPPRILPPVLPFSLVVLSLPIALLRLNGLPLRRARLVASPFSSPFLTPLFPRFLLSSLPHPPLHPCSYSAPTSIAARYDEQSTGRSMK